MTGWITGVLQRLHVAATRAQSLAATSTPPAGMEPESAATSPLAAALRASPPPWRGPLGDVPRGRERAMLVYGNPTRGGKLDPAWERRSMVVSTGLEGAWNDGRGRLYVHRLVEPYVREALTRCAVAGVLVDVERLGCFNYRHQRHDPERPVSYHGFGVAVDLNSERNRGVYFSGDPPACFSRAWWACWPRGMSEALVDCFESVGFTWGGRWRGRDSHGRAFVDPMHFQLVR